MASRRRRAPIAISLDHRVEALMDQCERVIEAVKPYDEVEELERQLVELRRAWLAEQTARAMLDD